MLGVSFSELAVTCLIAFLVMRPQDIRKVAYWYKYILKQITELKTIAQDSIDDINEETKAIKALTESKHVIDKYHKPQKAYDDNPLNQDDS